MMLPFMQKPFKSKGSFLFRLIAANTVVFVSSLLIISGINYYYTTMISEKQTAETYKKWLAQTDYNIETLYERVFQIGEQLLKDTDIVKGLYSDQMGPLDSMKVSNRLKDVVNGNDFINSVYLYNGKTGRFMHTLPQDIDIATIDPDAASLIRVRNNMGKMIFLPHKQEYVYNGKEFNNPILSLILTLSDAKTEYAIFLNLKISAVQDLFNKMGNSDYSNFIIVDKNGVNIIHSKQPDWFMTNIGNQLFIDKVVHANKPLDNFINKVNGNKSLVTYIYNEKLEWYLINTTRYEYLSKDIFILQRNIVIVSLLVLLMSIFATVFMNRKIYGPFGNFVKMIKGNHSFHPLPGHDNEVEYISDVFKGLIGKVTSLEDSVSKDRDKLKEAFLKDLINNEGAIEEREIPGFFAQYEIKVKWEQMRVFVIILGGEYGIVSDPLDTRMVLVKDAMYELALRIFHENEGIEKVETGNHSFVLIMNDPAENRLKEKVDAYLHQVEKIMSIPVKIGIGVRVQTALELSRSYETAKEALTYKFIMSGESAFYYDMIQAQSATQFHYPVKLETSLFNCIKLNHSADAHKIIDELFAEIKWYPVANIHPALKQLVYRLENEFHAMLDFSPLYLSYQQDSLTGIINSFHELERIKAFNMELVDFIIQGLKKNRNRDSGGLVKNACDYIQRNYNKSDLSADSVATELNISVPYFSKLFNEHMRITFSNYVTDLRIKEAENLLLTTTLSVKEIGEMVGFLTSSYFITVFKKKYAVSPNQFRQLKKAD